MHGPILRKDKMNTNELKSIISKGLFPNEYTHFGGADLIITDNHNFKGNIGDTVIWTSHASAFSWLVYQLKEIHSQNLNYSNKFEFYPLIGELIQESFKNEGDIIESMLYVVDEIEKIWQNHS
jgi:hypothetical protein